MPAWTGPTFWSPGTWGGTNPTTGASQSWYDTPLVRDDLSQELPYGEFERFLTNAGFGGIGDRRSEWGRSLYNRTRSGYDAAQLDNPNLNYRDYLQTLPNFDDLYASLSGAARGDSTPGQTRRILWG